ILMARLTKMCPVNPRQRGFIPVVGCSDNLKLLPLIVKHAKKDQRDLGIVFVDIAKAFDTVCHQHIIMSLMQREADPHTIHVIGNMYETIHTYID
ncbi:POLR protein, partial [Origma solitaria]|nr:POLR protein [Origma solitaria]